MTNRKSRTCFLFARTSLVAIHILIPSTASLRDVTAAMHAAIGSGHWLWALPSVIALYAIGTELLSTQPLSFKNGGSRA